MNAAAGATAAHVGAQLNGFSPDGLAIRMGALAGTTKAALLIFREIVSSNGVNMVFWVLLFLVTSSFGICPLLVTEISNIVLEESEFFFPWKGAGGEVGKARRGPDADNSDSPSRVHDCWRCCGGSALLRDDPEYKARA